MFQDQLHIDLLCKYTHTRAHTHTNTRTHTHTHTANLLNDLFKMQKSYFADRIDCHDGFFGEVCENICSGHCTTTACDKQDGSCKCKVGYAGNHCTECPPNCDPTGCDDAFHCYTCNPGFYGDFCNETCSEHCLNNTCNRAGICHECDPGFYGDYCNLNCSTYCIDGTCNRDGRCNCSVGYGGNPCEPCPRNCADTGCDEQLMS